MPVAVRLVREVAALPGGSTAAIEKLVAPLQAFLSRLSSGLQDEGAGRTLELAASTAASGRLHLRLSVAARPSGVPGGPSSVKLLAIDDPALAGLRETFDEVKADPGPDGSLEIRLTPVLRD